jgi:hypothetical protein
MGRLWSDLFDRPGRLAVELDKVGTTSRFLVLDLRDAARENSTLQTELNRVGPAGWLLLALEWFGDLGNPQPTNRTLWSGAFRTPDWTVPRFPPLEDDEEPMSRLQRRDPLPTRQTLEAVRLRGDEGKSWLQIEEAVRLSHRKVDYIRQAMKHEDLAWDSDHGCTTFGPDTLNTPAGIVLPVR